MTNKNKFHFIDYDFSFFTNEDFKKKFDLKNNVILDTDLFQIDKSNKLTHFQKDYFKLAIVLLQHFFLIIFTLKKINIYFLWICCCFENLQSFLV
ncbi:hypothetical protein [Mesomycoplasma hyorhinis]|uniref:hypothetical protein n=1 Tax=Mesomycoplasma hyorhinis TaxID=2100 RepID=UPI00280AAA32